MKNIIKALKRSKRVGIIAHISADADCIGSMSALYCILIQLGKEVTKFVDDTHITNSYDFLKVNEIITEDMDTSQFDLLISVDVASGRLLGKYINSFNRFDNTISIDHHLSRDLKAKYVYCDSNSSSCSEIIYRLAKELKCKITTEIASFLFAGIIGDTNCFENDNTTNGTHIVASELMNYDIDTSRIIYNLHKRVTKEQISLRKLVYQNMICQNNVAYIILTKKMFKEAGTDDCPDFVNELLNIEGTLISFVVKQKEKNTYTVSFRCKKGYNVADIATLFNGGGHIQASGCSFVGSPIKNSKILFEQCAKQIEDSRNV